MRKKSKAVKSKVVEPGEATPPPLDEQDRIEFYKDQAGEIRWRFRSAGNSKVLADSGEGYTDFADAWRAAERVTRRQLVEPGHTRGQVGLLDPIVVVLPDDYSG